MGAQDGHISDEELVQFYTDASALTAERQRAVTLHVSKCALCKEELDLLESSESDLRKVLGDHQGSQITSPPQSRLRSIIFHPVFAAAVLLLVALPIVLRWSSSPTGEKTAPISIPAPVELHEPSRSSGTTQVIKVPVGESLLHLEIVYPHLLAERSYSIVLSSPQAAAVTQLPLWQNFDVQGRIGILVDATGLTAGNYELQILDIGRFTPEDTLVTTYLFMLQRENPQPH